MSSQSLPELSPSSGAQRYPTMNIMLTGIATLIIVMGIGRFSLTPQIPLMIRDGYLSLSSAGILAAMNYIGYLLGAIHVSRLRTGHAIFLKAGLLITAFVTLLSGSASGFILQCLFRFIAGVGGAWALIIVTSWTQLMLAGRQAPRLSAAVFTGPGIGITLAGFMAWLMSLFGLTSSCAWYVYGTVALIATALIYRRLPASLPASNSNSRPEPLSRNLRYLLTAYTLAGFGYILPATFLSQMAHHVFSQGNMAAFFWPLFGLSAVVGVMLVILFSARISLKPALAIAMIGQGIGVGWTVFFSGASGLMFSTMLTGLGFLSIMQLTMRLAREISTGAMARNVAVLTSGYASGQLIGPLISSASVTLFSSLQPALLLAAVGLGLGGMMVLVFIRTPE